MIEMFELNSKKFLALLKKYKKSDDKESFKSEYCDIFPIIIKYSKPDDIESCLYEDE